MINLSRRQFTLAVSAASLPILGLTGPSMANETTQPAALTLVQSVQRALREIGSAGCIAAAQELGQASAQSSSINIHLRRAEIDDGGAALIARALKAVPNGERAKLRSFSLSYNKIGDRGALAIAGALPQTLTELGLVGCSIGDNGGQAVLHWAQQAAGLSMICIEDNTMSAQMQDSFRTLRNASRRVAVFV